MFNSNKHIAERNDGSVYYAEIDIQTDRFMVQAYFSDKGNFADGQVTVTLARAEDRGKPIWSDDGMTLATVSLQPKMTRQRLLKAVTSAIKSARIELANDYRYGVPDLRHYEGEYLDWQIAA